MFVSSVDHRAKFVDHSSMCFDKEEDGTTLRSSLPSRSEPSFASSAKRMLHDKEFAEDAKVGAGCEVV